MNRLKFALSLWIITLSVIPCHARDYVLVVDTSGSMLWTVKGEKKPTPANPSRISLVKPALKAGLEALPDGTRVTLIEFNTGVRSVKDFVFDRPEARAAAVRWVEDLNPPPNGDTHLWAAMRQAFQVMRGYLKQSENQKRSGQVLVRFYTDGDNVDKSPETRALNLQQVLAEFPEIDGKAIRPDIVLLGPDLSMSVEVQKIMAELRLNGITSPAFIVPFPPVIFWRPDPIVEGQLTSFLEKSKSIYNGYEWTLDGKIAGKEKLLDVPTLTAGPHRITLQVTHANGLSDSSEETLTVLPRKMAPPDPAFEVLPHISYTIGDTLTLRAKQKDDAKHEWLADGAMLPDNGSEIQWKGSKEGEVKLTHRATAQGGTSESTVTVVGNKMPPPEAAFEVLPDITFHPGDKLTFRAKQPKPEWKHEWLLDNGVKLEGTEASWTADKPGRVKVTHRVTSSSGVVEAQQTLIGSEIDRPDAGFSATPRIFTVGDTVTLKAKSDKPDWQHTWLVQTPQGKQELKGAQAAWKSDAEGKVAIRHTVVAGSITNAADDEIAGHLQLKVVAKFKASPHSGAHPLSVQFTDSSIPSDQIAEYTWDFGDGSPASHEKNPMHVYTKIGRYPVMLRVITSQRETAESAERIEIVAKPTWGEWLIGMPAWVKILAGLLVLGLLWSRIQKLLGAPLIGQVEWRYGSTGATIQLRGKRSFNLSTQLAAALKAGWKPRKQWVIRNSGGKMKLHGGIKPQTLENDKPISTEGVTIIFKL